MLTLKNAEWKIKMNILGGEEQIKCQLCHANPNYYLTKEMVMIKIQQICEER